MRKCSCSKWEPNNPLWEISLKRGFHPFPSMCMKLSVLLPKLLSLFSCLCAISPLAVCAGCLTLIISPSINLRCWWCPGVGGQQCERPESYKQNWSWMSPRPHRVMIYGSYSLVFTAGLPYRDAACVCVCLEGMVECLCVCVCV